MCTQTFGPHYTWKLLTHSCFSIRIGVHLAVVFDDWQAGGDARDFILTVLWAGAATAVFTAAVIPVKHPKRISPLPLWAGSVLSLGMKNVEKLKKERSNVKLMEEQRKTRIKTHLYTTNTSINDYLWHNTAWLILQSVITIIFILVHQCFNELGIRKQTISHE